MIAPLPGLPSLREASRTWAKIGVMSFGGPAGQIAVMHRLLVDEKKWVAEDQFLHALKFCTLLPGPEAQQLATYLGWSLHGRRGGLIAGTLFIAPGVIIMLGLSLAYRFVAGLGAIETVFGVIRPLVLVIVLDALLRIGRRSLPSNRLRLLAVAAFIALFVFHLPFPILVIASGVIGLLIGNPDRTVSVRTEPPRTKDSFWATVLIGLALWWVPIGGLFFVLGSHHVLSQMSVLWSKAAVVTFGGAYAVLDYVRVAAVQAGWLTPKAMLDGLSLAETTPGPLILVLQFVGFQGGWQFANPLSPLAGGLLGAVVNVWTTFVPSIMFVLAGAPYVEQLRHQPRLGAALSGISAAVVGVVANLSIWFFLQVLFRDHHSLSVGPIAIDLPIVASINPIAAGLAGMGAIAVFKFKQGIGRVLIAGALLGILLATAG